MTTVFASPLPVVEEETAQQKEEGLTKDVDFRTVVKEVFLDGNMPLTQEYIISSINAKSKCSSVANSCDRLFAKPRAAWIACSSVVENEGTLGAPVKLRQGSTPT